MTVPKFQRMYEKYEGLACWPSALWTPRFPDTCQKNETPIRGKTRIPAFSKPLHLRGSSDWTRASFGERSVVQGIKCCLCLQHI